MIYATSDLHGRLPPIPEDAEILLLAGDICPDFPAQSNRHWDLVDKYGHKQAAWLTEWFRPWVESAVERSGGKLRVVATWGNHDFVGEHPHLVPEVKNLTWLVDAEVEVFSEHYGRPLRIYGTPWVPNLPYWAFHAGERTLQLRADAIPDGLDVLMSHGPPKGAGGWIPTGRHNGIDVGEQALTDAICRAKPIITICGHIHEGVGAYSLDGNIVRNVAAVDGKYHPYDEMIVPLVP